MAETLLQLRGITKWFGAVKAVDDLSLDLKAGETFTFLGPSGCGKTTTLRMIAGLETPDEGEILLNGVPVTSVPKKIYTPPERRRMGMVFQSYAIWPHMTVAENVGYPLRVRHVPRAETRERVGKVLELVGLNGFEDRPAPMLSGGQQQRVALARALVYEPAVLLLDEPLSNLDAKLRKQMCVELKQLQQKLGLTLVYVTHDQAEALSLSDGMALMNFGKIEQVGPPQELYQRPRTIFARDFLGKSVTVAGRVSALAADHLEVDFPDMGARMRCQRMDDQGFAVGQSVAVSTRPEAVVVETAGNGAKDGSLNRLEGVVEAMLYMGDRSECEVRAGHETLSILVDGDRPIRRGQPIALRFPPDKLTVWPQ
jgi:ABC-type Fe3+/spermidine/putrescine transport system ATPase subunit